MRCYRKILHISYKDHVTNEEVRAKIQQAIGPHEDLLKIVKRRKLQWYGHVFRSLGLAKTILQGTVKGGRRQGRQRKRWEDSIKEWTGLEFVKSQRAVENTEKWRKLIAKSSVVPQRPPRLGGSIFSLNLLNVMVIVWLSVPPVVCRTVLFTYALMTLTLISCPHGLTITWWGCCGLCLWHKPTKLAHSFLFCSCVCFCLYGPFNCISFHKLSRQLFAFSLGSSGLNSALLVLSTIYLFMKLSLSPDVILCGWLGLKHQLTN